MKRILQRISAAFDKDKFERLERIQDRVEQRYNNERLGKILLFGIGGVAVSFLVYMMLPSLHDRVSEAESHDSGNLIHSTVVPLQTTQGETWADFRQKILEDGRKNKHFLGTMAYLQNNCNIETTATQKEKYRRTYEALKNVKYLRDTPEMQLLKNCRILTADKDPVLVLSQVLKPTVREFDRERVLNELNGLLAEMRQLAFKESSIIESRKVNKEVHGQYYDEKTGTFLTSEKSQDMLNAENMERAQWAYIQERRKRIEQRLQDVTGKSFAELETITRGQAALVPSGASQAAPVNHSTGKP
ncbi:hypothetical protein [Conchiformibius steedae]|uniref:hypothetical protein n=1 Tax=Conchiformibius steedae TaxID=153493 RepID=UPI0026F02C98|nr:hypothetical protein [Conchiformibius steedae]